MYLAYQTNLVERLVWLWSNIAPQPYQTPITDCDYGSSCVVTVTKLSTVGVPNSICDMSG